MHPRFPIGHEEKRTALLAAVEGVREIVTSHADEAEAMATLPPATVDALMASGLLTLKLPTVLGGAEADPVTQVEVIEALSAMEPSAGWCTMIGATGIGLPAAFLAEEAIAHLFAGGHIPTAAIVAMPTGQAIPVEGGYRVSGRWSFVSGVRHAQWITAGVRVVRAGDAPPEQRMMVFPAAAAQIHDNWQVAGLQGTGSCDVSLTEYVVPDAFTWEPLHAQPQRGGPLYRLGLPGFVANEHAAFALGVGRCALETVMALARSKRRGFTPSPSHLEARPAFQRAVGVGDLRLRAARALRAGDLCRSVGDALRGSEPIAALAGRDAECRSLCHRSRRRRDDASLSLCGGHGGVSDAALAAVSARHQRGGPAPHGERHHLRDAWAICPGSARC